MNKVERIFKWLNDGYSIKKVGQMHTSIVKNGNFFNYTNFGSSAIKANKKELEWLLTEIFDDSEEFYIIGNDGYFRSTSDLIDITDRKTYTFTLWSRDIFTRQEKPLKQYEMTLSEMLRSYYDVAEKYYKDHKMNKPHFAISCENPFFRYWNFCI